MSYLSYRNFCYEILNNKNTSHSNITLEKFHTTRLQSFAYYAILQGIKPGSDLRSISFWTEFRCPLILASFDVPSFKLRCKYNIKRDLRQDSSFWRKEKLNKESCIENLGNLNRPWVLSGGKCSETPKLQYIQFLCIDWFQFNLQTRKFHLKQKVFNDTLFKISRCMNSSYCRVIFDSFAIVS